MIDKAFAILAKIPTTALRVIITIALTVATGVMYFTTAFIPSVEWLGFLAMMSGLDVSQYALKRHTEHKPEEVARAEILRNGHDVDIELNARAGEEEMG